MENAPMEPHATPNAQVVMEPRLANALNVRLTTTWSIQPAMTPALMVTSLKTDHAYSAAFPAKHALLPLHVRVVSTDITIIKGNVI